MDAQAYIRRSEEMIQSLFIEPLTEMLRPLHEGPKEIRKAYLMAWMSQEYFVSRDFPRWLAGLAFYLDDPEDRDLVVTNMWEEHGSGDPSRAHFALYGAMLKSLDCLPSSVEKSDHTAEYMARVQKELEGGVLSALANLGPANEFLIRYEYGAVHKLFETCGWLNDSVSDFFQSNIDADFTHWDNLAEVVKRQLELDSANGEQKGEEFLEAVALSYKSRLFFFEQFQNIIAGEQ